MEMPPSSQPLPAWGRDERQLVTRACDACRKKKIRCEPVSQGCAQCTRQGTACHFTPIATTRKRRRPAGFKYIAQLEERLSEVVGLLQDKSQREPDHRYNDTQRADETVPSSLTLDLPSFSNLNEKDPSAQAPQIALVDEMMNPWAPFEDGSGIYSLDDFPISTVDPTMNFPISPNQPSAELRSSPYKQYQKIPTQTVAVELVHTTFTLYNRYVPLFDEEDFWTEFNLKYSISEFADPGWWACLNVVLSIAHRLRSLSTLDPAMHNNMASGYLQNALSVVTELSVSTRSLSAVQALTGMACILQGTADSEPASMLTAASLRLAQAMNLHRECVNSGLTKAEAEIRRRVFWKTYILDKDISLRTGRPFSQDDEEMDVQLPSSTSREPSSMDSFRHRVGLAVIQGQVYKQLYSIRAEKQSAEQKASAAETLGSLLSYWKFGAALEPAEDSSEILGGQVEGDMLHKIVLRLTYLHCLSMIDRHLPPASNTLTEQTLDDSGQAVSSDNLYLTESRKAFHLFETIPHGDRSCVWLLLHAFFAAASKMLCNAAQYPESPESLTDLQLVQPFLVLLETLCRELKPCSRSEEVREMHGTCMVLNNRATQAIHQSSLRTVGTLS